MRAGLLSNFSLGVNALRRDWRSGELRLLLLALLIAVAAVSSVGFLSDRVGRALERDAGQMLGGDLALQADEPIPAQFLAQASRQGLDNAQTMQFPSLVSGCRASQLSRSATRSVGEECSRPGKPRRSPYYSNKQKVNIYY